MVARNDMSSEDMIFCSIKVSGESEVASCFQMFTHMDFLVFLEVFHHI